MNTTSCLEALLRNEDEGTQMKREGEIKGDFKNERGRMKEEDRKRKEKQNSGDGNNERENLMGETKK